MNLDTLTDDVLARCDRLGGISEEPGRLTRTFLCDRVREVHELLTSWMTQAGLAVRLDAAGNLVGQSMPASRHERVFLVGSHIDTVPDAGKYDGVLGVLLGIAAAKALRRKRFPRRLDVIAFSEEEGVRFRKPYIGSLAVCGKLDAKFLATRDAGGHSVADAIRHLGLDPAELPQAAYAPGSVVGYLEAHIEQGPVLEALDRSLGIVPAIMGQTRAGFTFTGQAGHAGTQPMEHRHDALAGAAQFVIAVENVARATPGLRATVGSLTVSPNAGNVVPGEVSLTLDVRHADDALRRQAFTTLHAEARAITKARRLKLRMKPTHDQEATLCDADLTQRLSGVMRKRRHFPEPIMSGAGHDAVVMASLCPVAMLFLRSPGGISHHPRESVRREDVRAALSVMIAFLEGELSRD